MSEEVILSDPKQYEIAYMLAGEDAAKEIRDTLANYKCEILHSGNLMAMKLAYPLKKHTSGFFGYTVFAIAPENVKGIKDTLALKAGVLRTLIITPPVKVAARSERPMTRTTGATARPASPAAVAPSVPAAMPIPEALSNEGLEKKLEEILK